MRFLGAVYRAHNPRWSWTPLSGEGAREFGGRFNRRGVSALYTSMDPLTAIRETMPLGRPLQPLTVCQYEVDCDNIVDVTDFATRAALAIDDEMLTCSQWEQQMNDGLIPASQALADRLIADGFCGIRVPSFATGVAENATNIVFWDWSPDLPNKVVVVDDDLRLPRSSASWKP